MDRTVLVVDDSGIMRATLRQMINGLVGWHVCGEAADGAEGIAAATKLKPDVVVLDFSMPVMNGIEAAAQIRKLVPEARLLMITLFATRAIEEAAHMAGIQAFVEKGSAARLLNALQQVA